MNDSIEMKDSYLIFSLANTTYCVKCRDLKSIVRLDKIHASPDLPKYIRGYIDTLDKMIPAIDLRLFINKSSIQDEATELIETIKARREEHVVWFNTLVECVTKNKKVKLETDHHKCEFGKWYDTFKTEDLGLRQFLFQFSGPHFELHNIAKYVFSLIEKNRNSEALKIIEDTKNNSYKDIISLFDSFGDIYRNSIKELAIVLQNNDRYMALIVDKVLYIDKIIEQNNLSNRYDMSAKNNFEVCKLSKNDLVALLFDTDWLFESINLLV
ncbi:MAG: chemotaxis protein CheW [Clostridiales bacterium]